MKLFLLILLIPTIQFAQNNYVVEYTITDNNDCDTKSTLAVNDKECIYRIGENKPIDKINTKKGDLDLLINRVSEFFYYSKGIAFHRFLKQNLEWFYNDNLEKKLNWTINNTVKKKIGIYDCTEAKININGRDFTVWFTYDIPFKFGPLKLHNLPGLIVEVIEKNNWLKISLVKFKKVKENQELFNYKKYIPESKFVTDYITYETDLSRKIISEKKRFLVITKEKKLQSATFENEIAVDYFLDIPENLLEKLKNLR